MSIWDNAAVTGAIGVAAGAATAYVQSALAARSKSGEELRDKRLEAYPQIWRQTSNLSRWPPAEMTWADLEELHLAFRSWYYTVGGLFMSELTRDRYGDAQEVIGAYLRSHQEQAPGARVDDRDYEAIAETCSAFRTAMTEDLATRRQRSFLLTVRSRRWHRHRAREAQARAKRFGGQPWRCPLDKMELAAPQSSTRPSNSANDAP